MTKYELKAQMDIRCAYKDNQIQQQGEAIDRLRSLNKELVDCLEASIQWHKGDPYRYETDPVLFASWKERKEGMDRLLAKAKGTT